MKTPKEDKRLSLGLIAFYMLIFLTSYCWNYEPKPKLIYHMTYEQMKKIVLKCDSIEAYNEDGYLVKF